MRHAFENPEEARERGQMASRHAHQNFLPGKIPPPLLHNGFGKLAGKSIFGAANRRAVPAHELPTAAQLGRLKEARELFGAKRISGRVGNRPSPPWRNVRFIPEAFLLLAEIALAAGDGKKREAMRPTRPRSCARLESGQTIFEKTAQGQGQAGMAGLASSRKSQTGNRTRLSVCLIVKNEEKFLAQCLKSVRDLAAQIIVVDTGSTDRTVEIAREFGAEIYSSAWSDDFAAARNAALEHATGDWILMLDADEEMPAAQHAQLLADLKKSSRPCVPAAAGERRTERRPEFRAASVPQRAGRLLSRPHSRAGFPKFAAALQKLGLENRAGHGGNFASRLHQGNGARPQQDRTQFEIAAPGDRRKSADVNLLMNLGLELVRSDDLAAGVEKYREAFQMMSAQPPGELVPELREVLLTQFTSQLYKIRAHDEVVECLNSPLARQGGLTASLHFALGLAHFELKQFSEAADQMRQCLSKRKQPALSPINTDILTAAPQHCLALSLAKLGDPVGAEKAYQAALAEPGAGENLRLDFARFLVAQVRFVDALRQLHAIIAQNPRHAAAWRLGGELTLSLPELLAFAREWTEEAARALPDDSVLAGQCAEALLLNGHTAAALGLWEKIWSRSRSSRTLAALILCELIEAPTTSAPDEGADEVAASRAFIAWYQKLIAVRAQLLIGKVNEQLDKLSRALPTAAQMLEAAFAETADCVPREHLVAPVDAPTVCEPMS